MAKKPRSGAEVAKDLMDKMRRKGAPAAAADAQTPAAIADSPTLEERMDATLSETLPPAAPEPRAAAAAAPAANVQTPKRVRMSGHDLAQMQRQERREKRLKERGY